VLDWLCDDVRTDLLAEKIEYFEATSETSASPADAERRRARHHHMGVVKSLWENSLLPHVISGSSAGSIVAACSAHNDEELRKVMTHRESLVGLIKWNSPPRLSLRRRALAPTEGASGDELRRRSVSGRAINITVTYDPLDEGRLLITAHRRTW
jgi:predicted acylesterase/phospholipase RssA